MTFHEFLPLVIVMLALSSGTYILLNIKKFKNDWVTRIYFVVLGLMYIYMGIIYALVLFGVVEAIPATQAAILMRPVNILAIVTPFLIANRMGL